MSEGQRALTYRDYISCSICGRLEEGDVVDNRPEHPDWLRSRKITMAFQERMKRQGWRRFVGRGVRWYCPAHGPSKTSTMQEIYWT